MRDLASGARRLPAHHITIRVPWHDGGWTGHVCGKPLDNTSCLVLKRIGAEKRDEVEVAHAGATLQSVPQLAMPPCVDERVAIMAPFDLARTKQHPYVETTPDLYGHFAPTAFRQPAYSAAAVPFKWMLRGEVEGDPHHDRQGLAERLGIGWIPDREPRLPFHSAWVQERENQLALLDTFFSGLRKDESLCFFYAKRTPLSEQSRRVIVGVGRVLSIGPSTEYQYTVSDPRLRCVLWERNIGHSIRPGFVDGFLFPYQDILRMASEGTIDDPQEFVAFAPDEQFDAFSYGSELLSHDGAVASLVACAAIIDRLKGVVEGPWDEVSAWVDTHLNRLWKARGPYPGLGAALAAYGYEWGFERAGLVAYEVELERERAGARDPWDIVDEVMAGSKQIGSIAPALIPGSMRRGWTSLDPQRRALLQLLARCSLTEHQARRIYDRTSRAEAGLVIGDSEVLQNPYRLFESDRRSHEPISFGTVDRGLFPEAMIREASPIPEPSRVEDPSDPRRVRALVVDLLEGAAADGHTLLPQSWVIRAARERALRPPCPLGESVLDATSSTFGDLIVTDTTKDGQPAYQVDRLAACRGVIRREVIGRLAGKPHEADIDWRAAVDDGLPPFQPADVSDAEREERARTEKAAALEQLHRSRLSVLVGPAGTGKTTLLRMLVDLPGVTERGVLLLAPTGKARVRLEEQTGRRGSGQTLAQFLLHFNRYSRRTGHYRVDPSAPRCSVFRTVVIDESSMLTEEQLAAVFDACANVERYVLVGDPRQLPPIGAGRPFVDIVAELEPSDVESAFPRCAPGYAELTILRRQRDPGAADGLLAQHFAGRAVDPGTDAVWDAVVDGQSDRLRTVQWNTPQDLQEKLIRELVDGLELAGPDDQLAFEESVGGERFGDLDRAFFWHRFGDHAGAAGKADAWQLLSPVRGGLEGVDAINRAIQAHFRAGWRQVAQREDWGRKVPGPFGSHQIIYGDKVINVVNQRRKDVYPAIDGEAYLANGDLGIVVGQYKGRSAKYKGLPWKLEVEFAGQLGHKYGFERREFGEEVDAPLELAYALTVHKTQGSEFGTTFVVIPNPCWLLSRELLYTALTRHRQRVVVLYQGPLHDLRRYASEEHSEIAQRVTNLFVNPDPREVRTARGSRFLEAGLIHRAEDGTLVRSKSELVIAGKLIGRGIAYAYEQPLVLPSGRTRYPDFTISDHARGVTFYWEHLGLLADAGYRALWEKKRAEYAEAGIRSWHDGGGENGILIETRDQMNGGLDAEEIARRIDEVILGGH